MDADDFRSRVEWVGGLVQSPLDVPGVELDVAVWLDADTVEIVAQEPVRRGEHSALAGILRRVLEDARAPDSLRVSDPSTASSVRAAVGGRIPITVAPTPEIEDVRDALASLVGGAAFGPGYLDADGVTVEGVRRFFERAADLAGRFPWDLVSERELMRLDVPALGVESACVAVIGRTIDMEGVFLFESPDDAARVLRAVENDDDHPPPLSWLSLDFVATSEAPRAQLLEAETYDWPVAGLLAFPHLVRFEGDACAGPTPRDLELMAIATGVIAQCISTHESQFEDGGVQRELRFDDTDPTARSSTRGTTLSIPYSGGGRSAATPATDVGRRVPDILGPDGGPPMLVFDLFDVQPTAVSEVVAALDALPGAEREPEEDGANVFSVSRDGHLVAHVRLADGGLLFGSELQVEAASEKRADELCADVERACGERVRHRERQVVRGD